MMSIKSYNESKSSLINNEEFWYLEMFWSLLFIYEGKIWEISEFKCLIAFGL